MSTPLVTCILPTRNRPAFTAQAVWYFLRQDYPSRELLVVDDGDEPVGESVPDDPRIRYIRLDHRISVGLKRNLACREARGELIAHWDDDDWHAPNRLSAQVAQMAPNVDVCGMRELLHYNMPKGEAWLYRAPDPAARPWLAGCTLLYRRSTWSARPFEDLNVGEDAMFVGGLAPGRVHPVADRSLVVALIHRANTAGKNLADRCWTQRPLSEVSSLLGADREFYVALRRGTPTLPAPRASTAIAVAAHFSVATGYGSMAEYLVRGLHRAGAQVHAVPLSLDADGLSDEFNRHLRLGAPPPASPTIYFCWPQPVLRDYLRDVPELFINTMWESGRLPAGWPELLNHARSLIVPSRFVADVCRGSGVSVPIDVIAEGVDPEVYGYEDRPERSGLTTLTVGPIEERKHVRTGIEAWKRAFAADADARLIVKTQYGYHNYTPDDDRITYIDAVEHTRGIAHWYRQADVLLALGNEGFGLPLVEGMATGLPVVALASEGQADVCGEAGDLVLSVPAATYEPYRTTTYGDCGPRGVPSVADVADRLRWVREHREEAREMGRAASAWALKHRNIWSKAPAVLDVLERRVQPPRPLRRHHTMWSPTFNQKCGIAEYTRDLTAPMRGIEVSTSAPDLRRVRVLHVQHHHSAFDDGQLATVLTRARMASIPAVVTEHLVHSVPSAWESDATMLVSPSGKGASLLAKRWPAKPVHYIPHGCPPPLPANRRRRRRVIGAFGFLEHHKGMFTLLDVLRDVPGTELLLFAYARSPEVAARWEEAAAGLPVTRISSYLPADEIARQLSEHADVVAFWYDDVPFGTASYAVRIGLSTGVPVLTSPTVWFEDLAEVTYQPSRLADGVRDLLDNGDTREALTAAARRYCEQHTWERIAARHDALWRTLEAN